MPNSYVEYTDTGSGTNGLGQTTFAAPTKFLSINDIRAKGFNGSTWTELTINEPRGTTTVTLSAVPSAFSIVRIYRATTSDQLIDFQAGARLAESDLDTAYNQGLFVAQEVSEDAGAVGSTSTTNLSLSGTTSVDNLTATGTVSLPNGAISNDNLAGSIASSKLAGGIDITSQVTGYEQGTFTFTTNSNMTFESGTNIGRYTKIGNLVHVQMNVKVDTVTSSNHAYLAGLPYAAVANTSGTGNSKAVGTFSGANVSSANTPIVPTIDNQSSTVYLEILSDNGNFTILTNGYFQASSEYNITISYLTA